MMRNITHDELVRRHRMRELTLMFLTVQGRVGSDAWDAVSKRETALREERINRVLHRD